MEILQSILDFFHIMATIMWIGGMIINYVVIRPALSKTLEPRQANEIMSLIMKKYRIIVYVSIAVLGLTGIPMKIASEYYVGIINFENTWEIVGFIKHIFVFILAVLAIYSFEILSVKIRKAMALDSPEKLMGFQKKQKMVGGLGFLCGMLIILLSAVMNYL